MEIILLHSFYKLNLYSEVVDFGDYRSMYCLLVGQFMY